MLWLQAQSTLDAVETELNSQNQDSVEFYDQILDAILESCTPAISNGYQLIDTTNDKSDNSGIKNSVRYS